MKKSSSTLSLNVKADKKPLAFIVNTIIEKLDSSLLNEQIKSLDLDEPHDLAKVLSKTIRYIKTEGL